MHLAPGYGLIQAALMGPAHDDCQNGPDDFLENFTDTEKSLIAEENWELGKIDCRGLEDFAADDRLGLLDAFFEGG